MKSLMESCTKGEERLKAFKKYSWGCWSEDKLPRIHFQAQNTHFTVHACL